MRPFWKHNRQEAGEEAQPNRELSARQTRKDINAVRSAVGSLIAVMEDLPEEYHLPRRRPDYRLNQQAAAATWVREDASPASGSINASWTGEEDGDGEEIGRIGYYTYSPNSIEITASGVLRMNAYGDGRFSYVQTDYIHTGPNSEAVVTLEDRGTDPQRALEATKHMLELVNTLPRE